MKAFVLAGGLGTRLRARFGDLPKALAPLGGTPFLVRQLEWLRAAGLPEVVVCAGHGADRLRDAVGGGEALGIAVRWSVEREPLGTGGALSLAARFVDGPALVVNGDTLPECDPWGLERERWENGSLGAVALFEVEEARARGRVELNGSGRIERFVEKDPAHRGAAWVNGGLYAFAPALWRRLPAGPSSLERDVLPALAAAGSLRGWKSPGSFYDIGTPEEWERAERHFAP
ncbi:MAG TPA: sugar phosphate nucleotidyltransferase [Candidatus Eisenbacteria bacterium]|jgi:NDP-sugar pyrophosphorylase family protein